jgi:ABC-type branched-subunit amino acid transport system substrate-binding protein
VVRLVVVALVAGALSGCNSSHDAVVATTVVAPPPGCDVSRVVVIGASLDLSGPGAAQGHAYLTGLEMGIAQVNKGNGVPPRNSCFELAYKDNRGNPAIDNQAMVDLVNVEKAGIVVGSFLGSPSAAYLGGLGVPAISLSNLATTFAPKDFPNTFPMTASMESQAFVIGATLKKEKVTSVGVVVTQDPASREGAAHLAAVASADGFTITGRAAVSPRGAGATRAVAAVRATHPKVLVVLDDAGAAGAVVSARAAAGWTVPVIAGPTLVQSQVLTRLGGATRGVSVDVPDGAIAGTGPGSSGTLHFRARLIAALKTRALTGTIIPYAQTYDAMTMMASAANGAMGVVSSDVTTYLQNANYQGVLASYTYTSGAHTGISASDQRVVPLDTLSDGVFRAPRNPTRSGG